MHQSFISLALLIATTLVAGFSRISTASSARHICVAMDGGVGGVRASLRGGDSGSVGSGEPSAECVEITGSLRFPECSFSGSAALLQRKAWIIPGLVVGVLLDCGRR